MEEETDQPMKYFRKVKSEFSHTANIDQKNIELPQPPPCPIHTCIILIRGSSYSLVEFPTFLPDNCTVKTCKCKCKGGNTEISLAEPDTNISVNSDVLCNLLLQSSPLMIIQAQSPQMMIQKPSKDTLSKFGFGTAQFSSLPRGKY